MQLFLSIASFAVGIIQLVLLFTKKPRGRHLALGVLMVMLLISAGVAWLQAYQSKWRLETVSAAIVELLDGGEQTTDGVYDGLPPADHPYVADALSSALKKGTVRQHSILLLAPDGRMIKARAFFVPAPRSAAD